MMDFLHTFISDFRLCFRNKVLTFINIFGLAGGLSICLFLLTYICFEFSYDKQYKDVDRIYRALSKVEYQGKIGCTPRCKRNLRSALLEEVPEVEYVAQIYPEWKYFRNEDRSAKYLEGGALVDSTFFDIFDCKSIYGDLSKAFTQPRQCVLTSSLATKLFGKDVDPTGRFVDDGEPNSCQVIAVIEDFPPNSHFDFEFLMSMPSSITEYEGCEFFTYLKFREGTQLKKAVEKCNGVNRKLLERHFGDRPTGSELEPLTSIRLSTLADWDLKDGPGMTAILFMCSIGLLVLFIAVSNFVALFMVQGEKRSKEICVRKTCGARRKNIILLIFKETGGITFIAFLLAVLFYYLFKGFYINFLSVDIPDVFDLKSIWFYCIILYLFTSFIAGIYPALYLSRLQPIELIRNSEQRKYRLTATSVMIQISIVLFCISTLWIVVKQLRFTMELPFGYETENVLVYNLGMREDHVNLIKEELSSYPEIISVGASQGGPVHENSGSGFYLADQDESEYILADEERVGAGYFETLGIPLVEGRLFTGRIVEDCSHVVLSETMVKAMQLTDPIGQAIRMGQREFTVIGVVKDTRYGSARKQPGNKVYTSYQNGFSRLYVRFQEGQYEKVCRLVEDVLDKHGWELPVNKELLKDNIMAAHAEEDRLIHILTLGGVLAVFLAFLGLVALYHFVARQRSKEIAIRRVAGADTTHILILMIKRMVIMAIPVLFFGGLAAVLVTRYWLEGFVFAIRMPFEVFIYTVLGVLIWIALLVCISSWETIIRNPVEALKTGE